MTKPDDHITIKELLIRHSRGTLENTHHREGIYTGDIEVPVFHDLTDMIEHKEELIRQKNELEQRIREEQNRGDQSDEQETQDTTTPKGTETPSEAS